MKFVYIALCLLPACASAAIVPTVMVGAHANQDGNCDDITDVDDCEADFSALEGDIGTLGIDSQYSKFDEFRYVSDLQIAVHDVENGRTPMITWYPHKVDLTCASYYDIAHQVYDSLLEDQAQALHDVGGPVLIRFAPAMDTDIHECAYSLEAQGDPEAEGAEFVAAWQHIVDKIHETAPNALFIWSPNTHSFAANNGDPVTTWQYYYPGAAYVDWIGSQVYNQGTTKLSIADNLSFQGWYDQASTMGKPLIFSETGAIGPDPQYPPCSNSTSAVPSPQSKWLYSIRANFSDTYPAMKAFVWFDVAAQNNIHCNNYTIRGDGADQFRSLLTRTYFQKKTP
ncbi:MAG TPA: glycosyl hydrolase [Rhizomicrobium sp.]|nr:glycosyl hydrolase [Rhizomicrobium sp.]